MFNIFNTDYIIFCSASQDYELEDTSRSMHNVGDTHAIESQGVWLKGDNKI